mmetsp:Transcript_42740/g.80065  ORF Transcript_42740/g.80065 Transcript_42740/m.80065 type:complete len:115 (-) Transcript_42740:614-958(-)
MPTRIQQGMFSEELAWDAFVEDAHAHTCRMNLGGFGMGRICQRCAEAFQIVDIGQVWHGQHLWKMIIRELDPRGAIDIPDVKVHLDGGFGRAQGALLLGVGMLSVPGWRSRCSG